MIPEQQIEELKKTTLLPIISQYVKLRRAGANYVGICPFHNERSPSFTVSVSRMHYKCFGCGESGDVITFLQKHNKLTFEEAIEQMAQSQGVQLQRAEEIDKAQNVSLSNEQARMFVAKEIVMATLQHYSHNKLFVWLRNLIGPDAALELMFRFYVGTAQDTGAIYWQVDQFFRIRTGQKIVYGDDGHRNKSVPPKRLFMQEDGYRPCFFGEHQLFEMQPGELVGVVESEKTVLLCSHFLPTLSGKKVYWMACCGSNGMTEEKMWALKGLDVILVPDFSYVARAIWGRVEMRRSKDPETGKTRIDPGGEVDKGFVSLAQRLSRIARVKFFDPFPEIVDGSDIADVLVLNTERVVPTEDVYLEPEYGALLVPSPLVAEQSPGDVETAETGHDWKPTVKIGFRVARIDNGRVRISGCDVRTQEEVETFFARNPIVTELVERLRMWEGEVEPIKEEVVS